MKFKVGDRVRWSDRMRPQSFRELGTVIKVGGNPSIAVEWDRPGHNNSMLWLTEHFEHAPIQTPFEQRVQQYINSELPQ